MGLLSTIGSGLKKALDTNLALFAAPVTTITKGVEAGIAQVEQMGAVERTARIGATAVVAGGAVYASGITAVRTAAATVATTVGKALIPKTPVGVVTAVVAAPAIVGAVARQPKKVAETIIKAPAELAQFGGDVADFAANPSLSTAKEVIAESPLISAAAGALLVGAAAKTIVPAVAGYMQTGAIKEQTEAIKESTAALGVGGVNPMPVAAPTTQPAGGAPMPQAVTPEIVGVSKTSTKRKKRARKAVMQPISQRVSVIVSNSANQRTTKNYITREVLAV